MINLITDLISFTQPTNLDRESLSVIESIAKIKTKVNECINEFNNLENKTREDYENFLKVISEYKNSISNELSNYYTKIDDVVNQFKDLINALTNIEKNIQWVIEQSEYVQNLAEENQSKIDKGTIATVDQIKELTPLLNYCDNFTLGNMYGVCSGSLKSEDIKKIKECSFKYFRIDLYWDKIETSKGVYNFNNSYANYEEINKLLIENNIIPYYILCYSNTLYSSEQNLNTDNAVEGFKNFVNACTNKFKNQGCYWEIYNEPNTENHWKNSSPKLYTNVVKNVYSIIKSNDPTSKIVGGALGNTLDNALMWVDKLCRYGILKYIDAFSTHPYSSNNPESFESYLIEFKGIMKKYCDREIELICGEVGYSNVPEWDGKGTNACVTDDEQANYTIRRILLNAKYNIKTLIYCLYSRNGSTTNIENYFGVYNHDKSDKLTSTLIKSILVPLKDYHYIENIETNLNYVIMKFADRIGNVKLVGWAINDDLKVTIEGVNYNLTQTPILINVKQKENRVAKEYNEIVQKYSSVSIAKDLLDNYKTEVVDYNEIIDKTGSPGNCSLKSGTKNAGFFGLVNPLEMGTLNNGKLYNGINLAEKIGMTEGISCNPNTPLMKFSYNNTILFIPMKPYRYNVYWNTLYDKGLVFGAEDRGYMPKGARGGDDLWIDGTDNSINTLNQQFTEHTPVGVVGDTIKLDGWKTPTNNTSVTIVSITNTKIMVTGTTLVSEEGNEISRISNDKYAKTQVCDVEIGLHTYRVRLLNTGNYIMKHSDDIYRGTISPHNEYNRLILPLHEHCKNHNWKFTQYCYDESGNQIIDQGAKLTDEDLQLINTKEGSYTWCQNADSKESWKRCFRGGLGASFINSQNAEERSSSNAWRPVLQLLR